MTDSLKVDHETTFHLFPTKSLLYKLFLHTYGDWKCDTWNKWEPWPHRSLRTINIMQYRDEDRNLFRYRLHLLGVCFAVCLVMKTYAAIFPSFESFLWLCPHQLQIPCHVDRPIAKWQGRLCSCRKSCSLFSFLHCWHIPKVAHSSSLKPILSAFIACFFPDDKLFSFFLMINLLNLHCKKI